MSRLFGLARTASEYFRNRWNRNVRAADDARDARGGGSRGSAMRTYLQGRGRQPRSRRGEPPTIGPVPPPVEPPLQPPPISPNPLQFPPPPTSPPSLPPQGPPGTIPPSTGGRDLPSPPKPPGKPWDKPPGNPWKPPKGPDYRDPPDEPPPPPEPPGPPDDDFGPELGHGDIELLGRGVQYDEDDFFAMMDVAEKTPHSSNVYSFFFERESRKHGIMYVTFQRTMEGGKKIMAPGPTYAYYDVPVKKAVEFRKSAKSSAGGAVWDELRIRGTYHGHQFQYQLIHVSGEYVPRKASPKGFVSRAVADLGVGRRSYRRNTLPPVRFNNGGPDRGGPNRGTPDRGQP